MRIDTIVPPSAEVQDEARRRARRIADGLFPHQVEGVAFLLGRRRAILADDMGLGKTRQAIVALHEAEPEGPYLVVCPASVKRNWEREIRLALPDARVHVVGPDPVPAPGTVGWVVVNYDLLRRHIDALLAHAWTGVVFDEAHYVKNHDSQRSKLGRKLVERASDAVIYALTGTPLTNRPRDLFPLLQLVRHPMSRSFLSFAKRYCAAYRNDWGWVTDGASNLEELRTQLHGVMVRRTKDEVLDLPPKVRTWLEVDVPEGTARREMRAVLRRLIRNDAGAESEPRFGMDGRMALLAELTKARFRIAGAKTERTIEFVEGAVAQGEKVLVFSCFDEPVRRVLEHFGDAAVSITGATPSGKRQGIVDRFQGDDAVRVLVANIQAGGVGLNLTAARQVVFNDLDWVPASHWQAEDRAYRIGQTGTVNVTYMLARGTVDEFVARALSVKASLVDAVVEGKGEAAGGDLLRELESLVASISPRLADESAGDDPVERLLAEVTREYESRHPEATAGGAFGECAGAAGGGARGAGPGALRVAHDAVPRGERVAGGRVVRAGGGRAGRRLQLSRVRVPRELQPRAEAEGGAGEGRRGAGRVRRGGGREGGMSAEDVGPVPVGYRVRVEEPEPDAPGQRAGARPAAAPGAGDRRAPVRASLEADARAGGAVRVLRAARVRAVGGREADHGMVGDGAGGAAGALGGAGDSGRVTAPHARTSHRAMSSPYSAA